MCTTNKLKDSKSKRKGKVGVELTDDYFQIEKSKEANSKPPEEENESRTLEKSVFVLTTVAVIVLTHGITWAQWMLPLTYAVSTPILVTIKTICYWKYKWQFFMVDFCYFANMLTYISLWVPGGRELSLVVFALSNGPVLVAAAVYRNSLVYHHHDKITSCYIHFLPALLTFCIRWYPETTSRYWIKPFVTGTPAFDFTWLYAAPFAFFFLHSVLYCLIVNVVARPKDPYVTSYSYLADKYDRLNCLGGPWGQGIVYYGMNWLFCLSSLFPAVLAYNYFPLHCALLALVFLIVLWNGGSYYVHIFSERGFNTME